MRKDTLDNSQINVFTYLLCLVNDDDMPAVCEIIGGMNIQALLQGLDKVKINQISKQMLREAFICLQKDVKSGAISCLPFILKMY